MTKFFVVAFLAAQQRATVSVSIPAAVFGSPSAPGCVLQADGSYKLPRVPLTVALYRNGLRASAPNEFTITGQVLKIATRIPNEIVLCDYTY
jgi:hypothetical protein